MNSRTFATLSSVFDVDGRPERRSSSTEVRPYLKRFHHSYVWVLHMASSPNAILNISNVSVTDFPIFTQNSTQILCSWKTLTFLSRENRQTRQTCDHIKKHSTMTKQDRAMRFSRRSSSNSLLESSTCRAPLDRRNGGLFWTFGNFPDSPCTASRGKQKPTNIYEDEHTADRIQTNPLISTRRISTNLNILCLTFGWTWQREGPTHTTFGAFGNVNLLHCIVGWNFGTGLTLNPKRFLICLLIRLIFPAMDSTIPENPTYRTMLFHKEKSELPTSLFRKRVAWCHLWPDL